MHDWEVFPWPFEDNQFDEIELINVLEHLSDTIKTMEELHRISKPGGTVTIRVPFWNSPDMYTDPTHKAFFSAKVWGFFDPSDIHCIQRPYYSTARFHVLDRIFWIKPRYYVPVKIRPIQRVLEILSNHISGIIWVQQVKLQSIKK